MQQRDEKKLANPCTFDACGESDEICRSSEANSDNVSLEEIINLGLW